MGEILIYVVVIAVSSVVVYYGSGMLETSASGLSKHYGLPAAVHGAVVVAVGSSFPELSSAVLSTLLHGEFALGLSAVVGSAIFNILVIPGLSALASPKKLQAEKLMIYKDAQFYIISVAVLLIAFSLAIIYFPQGEKLTGELTPMLALIPLLLYGLYIFIQYQEVSESNEKREKSKSVGKLWLKLLLSLVLVVLSVEGLVRSSLFFGDEFNIPAFFWGITVIAIVTSIPDAMVSIRMARKGQHTASLSNVLGSNVFDLLVAIPAGVLLAGGTTIDFAMAVPLMGMLTLATIILFTTMRTSLELSNREAIILLATYTLMIAWVVLESMGVLNILQGI